MASLANYVEQGFSTGLVQALIAIWPNREVGREYAQLQLAAVIERMRWTMIPATLDGAHCSPTDAFLASVTDTKSRRPRHHDLSAALDAALQPRLKTSPSVLVLDAVERWAAPAWQADVATYRAWVQAQQGRLFVVYNICDRAAARFLFQRHSEPLYGQGMMLPVDVGGEVL